MSATVRVPLQVPAARPVLPWILGLAAATLWSLTGPLWSALVVLGAAVATVGLHRDVRHAPHRLVPLVGAMGFVLLASTLVTPVWLHLGTALDVSSAVAVGAALGLRLAAITAWGLALSVVRGPQDWLAAAAGWPRFALVLAVGFRQVQAVGGDVVRVRRAQRARGLLVGRGAGPARSLLVPVVTRSLERADRVGRTLTVAGWGRRPQTALMRTAYRLPHGVLLVVAVCAGAAWIAVYV